MSPPRLGVGGTPSTPRPLAGLSLSSLASSVQSSRHSKLEKADILEMTVKHLRNLQRAQMTGEGGSPRPPLRASLSPRGDFFQTSARGCERHSATFYCLGSLLRSHGLGLIYSHNSKLLLFRKGRERGCNSKGCGRLGSGGSGWERKDLEPWRFLSCVEPGVIWFNTPSSPTTEREIRLGWWRRGEGYYPRSHRERVGRRQI